MKVTSAISAVTKQNSKNNEKEQVFGETGSSRRWLSCSVQFSRSGLAEITHFTFNQD